MKKYTFAIAAFAAVLLIAGLALTAQSKDRDERPGFGGPSVGCPFFPGGPAGTLNLTTDQQKKLVDLQEKFFDDNDKIADEIVKKERAMRKLFFAEKPDIKAIDKAQDEIKTLADRRIALSREFRNKARALLTDEQLKADPYAFVGPGFGMGPGLCPYGGPGFGPGGGMMGRGWGRGWDDDRGWGGGHHKWWKGYRR